MWNNTPKRMLLACWMILPSILLDISQAQQTPYFTSAQFSNISHRNDVCDRFADYASGKIEVRQALSGLQLSVGVVEREVPSYFNFHRNNNTIDEYNPGIFAVILDELARRANFTWRDSYGLILDMKELEGELQDKSWTDVLVDSVERYDVSFAEWVHSSARRERGVFFPEGWYDTSTIFIRDTRAGIKNKFNFESWTEPLHWSLWLLFALGFIYNRALYWVLDKIEDDGSPRQITSKEKAFRIRMVELVFDSDRSNAKRLHNMSASLFAMVFVSSLTANLATFLIQQSEPDFQYVGLKDLDSRFVPVCVRDKDAIFETLTNDFQTMNYKIQEDPEQNYIDLLARKCRVLATRRADFDIYERKKRTNPDCTLEWVGRPEYITFGGMGTIVDMNNKCTSLVGHVLDLYMHEMTDFLEEAWQNYLDSLSDYQCPKKEVIEDTRYSLTLNDIGGIFIVYGCLAIVGLFVTMIEQHFERKRKAAIAASNDDDDDLNLSETDGANLPASGAPRRGARASVAADSDVLRRILLIDRTIAKLQYQMSQPERRSSGEKRLSGSGLTGSFRRLSGSFKRLSGSNRSDSPPPSPRNSGAAIPPTRPSLSELGKRKSQQNILAMG